MKALDPKKNETCEFLRCYQGEKTDMKKMMQRIKIQKD